MNSRKITCDGYEDESDDEESEEDEDEDEVNKEDYFEVGFIGDKEVCEIIYL